MESKGVCSACNRTISGRGMTRHLQSCPEREKLQLKQGDGKVFLIKASAGPFWVYFEVNDSSTLRDIDSFLRNLWLECYGHMSAFTIGSVRYYSDLFQNIKRNGAYPIEVLDDGTVKTGETDKLKFWLLVWVPDISLDQVKTIVEQNKYVKKAEGDVGRKLDLCKHCK